MNTSKLTFQVFSDKRGRLVSLENNKNIPFAIERIYYLYDSNTDHHRAHAHLKLKQILICISGSCEIEVDNGLKTFKPIILLKVLYRWRIERNKISTKKLLVVLEDTI